MKVDPYTGNDLVEMRKLYSNELEEWSRVYNLEYYKLVPIYNLEKCIPLSCICCPNHPINNGSGICNCISPNIMH